MGSKAEKALFCRRCKVAPKLVKEEGRSDTIICPLCNRSADQKIAFELAGRHFFQGEIDSLRDRLARSARSSKHIRYIKGNRKKTVAPDFILD